MSERAIYERTAAESVARYHNDPRFRAIVQSVVHEAMGEYIERNRDADHREADQLAKNVAAILMERIFKEDAELNAQRQMADQYRKVAESALGASNRPPLILPLA